MKSKTATNVVQGDLFSGFGGAINAASDSVGEHLPMPDAKVTFYRNFFDLQESDEMFRILLNEINWRQDRMKLYGKEIDLPSSLSW